MNFAVEVEVRFRDLDPMGHVNNAVYLTYFEIARTAYMQQMARFEGLHDINFVVARVECNYRQGARFGQRLRIECGTVTLGRTSLTLAYRISADGALLADGQTVLVWFDYQKNEKLEVPEAVRQRILAFEGGLNQ